VGHHCLNLILSYLIFNYQNNLIDSLPVHLKSVDFYLFYEDLKAFQRLVLLPLFWLDRNQIKGLIVNKESIGDHCY